MTRPAAAVALGTTAAGERVLLTDAQLAAHALIVGASGAGKTTTMLGILHAQILRGHPVIAIDMKGSPGFAQSLREAAHRAGRDLRVWSPDGPTHWNPIAHGNPTAIKDRIMLTERFSEPHYMRAAERYVQTAITVLQAAHPGRPTQLDEVVAVLEPRRLARVLRWVPEPLQERVRDYLGGLTRDQVSAVRGLGTRLAVLTESSAGPFLVPAPDGRVPEIDLRAGMAGGDVILLSLNSSVYGQLSAQLGALALQELTAAAGNRLEALGPDGGAFGVPPVTVAIDEFSALGADNVLALLARGREAQVTVLLATQELADLERAAPGFRDQVLGITGVKVAHRQDVPSSALLVAQMAGTSRTWERTYQINGPLSRQRGSRGTWRAAERFVVEPTEVTRLGPGRAVVLTKLPAAKVHRVQVARPPSGTDLGAER